MDFVSDDGSHFDPLTRFSFEVLYSIIRPGGFYMIEDLGSSMHSEGHGIYQFFMTLTRALYVSTSTECQALTRISGFCNETEYIQHFQSITVIKKWYQRSPPKSKFGLDNPKFGAYAAYINHKKTAVLQGEYRRDPSNREVFGH